MMKLTKKSLIVAIIGALICGAVYLDFLSADSKVHGKELLDGYSTNAPASPHEDQTPPEASDYFSQARLNRQVTRDESAELLLQIVEGDFATQEEKNNAVSDMNLLAQTMQSETNIETLVCAKGFEECLAVVSSGNVNVIVKTDGLEAEQATQIRDIVLSETECEVKNIKIIEAK